MTQEEFKTIHAVLANAIKGSEFENNSFYVGGTVRDVKLNRPINDIHIVVKKENGALDFVDYVTKKLGIYNDFLNNFNIIKFPISQKAKFSLKQVLPKLDNTTIIVTTSSKNVSSQPNHVAEFGSLRQDALSRDFTINAYYCKVSNLNLFDITNSTVNDLKAQIIKCPSDPDKIFQADPIRILRGIRFATELNWNIEKNTWLGMCKNAYLLKGVSFFLVQKELNKILLSKTPSIGIRRLLYCGALNVILPEISNMKDVNQGPRFDTDVFNHTLKILDKTKPLLTNRLAALLLNCGKVDCYTTNVLNEPSFNGYEHFSASLAKAILEDYHYSSSIIEKVKLVIKNHTRFKQSSNPSNHSLKKFVADVDESNVELCLDIIEAYNTSFAPKYCIKDQTNKIRTRLTLATNKKAKSNISIPINGQDIITHFKIKPSPLVGKCISFIQECASCMPKMTKEEAFELAETIIKKS